jgi:gamma-glutamyltranspeptidase/glutathione hydrolase
MINFGMDPQEALDKPRFKVAVSNTDHAVGKTIQLEQGITQDVAEGLRTMGYNVEHNSTFLNFGWGQIIQEKMSGGKEGRRVYWAGSDPRADGMAIGF